MNSNRLLLVLLFLLSYVASGFSDVFDQAAGGSTTNSVLPTLENTKPLDDHHDLASIKAKAEKGDADAEYELGMAFCETNETAGIKWLVKAAEQNNKNACYALGVRFDVVDSPEINRQKAFKFALRGAQLGDMDCASLVGMYYLVGIGTDTNAAEGIKWIQKAAEQGDLRSQLNLAHSYERGEDVLQSDVEAAKWYRKAADAGDAGAQTTLASFYLTAKGVPRDYKQAFALYSKAAKNGYVAGRAGVAFCLSNGWGTPIDYAEAFKIYRDLAFGGDASSQNNLASMYEDGKGVSQDFVEAYKWYNLAAGGDLPSHMQDLIAKHREELASRMTPSQIAEAQTLSREFKPKKSHSIKQNENIAQEPENPTATGTGFFITEDGYLISNYHVVKAATKVRLVTRAGTVDAKVVQVDAANDLALLKADGKFSPLPIAASRSAHLGGTVATIGFPDPSLQGFSPKLAKGEIASLSGAGDDPRYFQISVPVQPGNSGGALVNERGNVIGIVSAKLDAAVALAASGSLPENVNYAVKSSLLLSFLESVPDVANKLKAPNTADEKFEDVVKSAQTAAVLVLVY